MKKVIKKIIKKTIRIILSPFIIRDYLLFARKKNKRFPIKLRDFYPQIKDKTIATNFDRHYIYHVAWAVRKVLEIKPIFHTDISSSLYFSSTLSASIPVKFYDYRPAQIKLSNLDSYSADLTELPFPDESLASLSCMHTVEHIGLGRYGDPIDPNGDLKAIKELKRVLAKNGSLLFVVPIGKPKIEFNAHRIYSYQMIKDLFSDLELREFYFIPESGSPSLNEKEEAANKSTYACGCFWFIKK
jgi:SAM-dependent methyltransferase